MDNIVATSANSVFNAPLATNAAGTAAVQTLNGFDEITAVGTGNRLNATLDSADASGVLIEGVQAFYLQSRDNTSAISMANVTGAEQLWNDRSTNNLTLTDVGNSVVLGLNAVKAGTYAVTYDSKASGGAQTIVAAGAGSATAAVTVTVTDAGTAIKSVTVNALTGTNNVVYTNADATTLTITGAGDLELDIKASTGLKTVSAGTTTGDLEIDMSGTTLGTKASPVAVTTGSGDDTVVLGNAQFVAGSYLTVDMGSGENVLGVSGATDKAKVDALVFKGDNISISNASAAVLTSNIALVNADVVTLSVDGLSLDAISFAGDIAFAAAGPVSATLALSKFAGDLVTFEGLVGAATKLVDLTASDVAGALTIETAEASVFGTVTAAKATSLSIVAEAALTATGITAAEATTLTVTTGEAAAGAVNIGTLTAAKATTITAIGEEDFTATIAAGSTKITSIDLSGLEGAATLTSTASAFAGVVTVEVGDGNVTAALNTGAGAKREIFQFGGEDIGTIGITGFVAGASSLTTDADRLDFSQFAGVTGFDDLVIDTTGGNTTITAADGQFDGTITVTGATLESWNFVF